MAAALQLARWSSSAWAVPPVVRAFVGRLELAVGCDDVATAEALHHDLARFDGLMIAASIGAVGPVAQFLGLIEALTGRLDEAIAHFESAVALAGIGDLGGGS